MQDLRSPVLTFFESRRLTLGLLLSLSIHLMLLSLVFGGQGLGLTGLGLPWQDRRTEIPDLYAVLLPMQGPAAAPMTMTLLHFAPPTELTSAASAPQATPENVVTAKTVAGYPSALTISPLFAERPNEKKAPAPKPAEDLIAMPKSDKSTWPVPAAPELPAPGAALAPPLLDVAEAKQELQRQAEQGQLERLETERQGTAKQAATQKEVARQEADRAEAARIEAERSEFVKQAAAKRTAEKQAVARQELIRPEVAQADAVRVEAERQAAAKQAATQQEAARAEAARVEAERQELAKQAAAREAAKQVAARQLATIQEAARAETARVEAARQEVVRQEAVRQEAVRQEAVRQEAVRQETARQAAAQHEAARLEAIRIESTRLAALQAEAEKRQEKLRAIGRQLSEEAARRDAAAAQRQLPSASSLRRGRLLGRTDSNAELVLYAEAWSRKIQLNMSFDMVREAAKQPHTDPMVTVAIRSDGSVESVSFVVASGVPAIDEAIRRIVHSHANYQAFPPALLKDFDVIEIRRTWYFDVAIRLY